MTLCDMPPSQRRIMARREKRVKAQDALTVARRQLAVVYSNYFAGVEEGETLERAEGVLYHLLQSEFGKPLSERKTA